MSASIVSGLMEMRNMIDQILESNGSSSAKVTKTGNVRKESSRKGKPTPHGDFTKKLCEEKKDQLAAYKTANPDKKGAHLSFVAEYKKEHADEYAAFETEWKLKHADSAPVSAAESAVESEASDAEVVVEKPKKTRPPMTEEHKAKLKAGREKKAAEKKAAKEAAV
jgi:hypothetical protein